MTDSTKTMKDQVIQLLNVEKTPKEIVEIVGCDVSYVYQVRKKMDGFVSRYKPRQASTEPKITNKDAKELKTLLDEYAKAWKSIDKVLKYLVDENSDLKDQVKQINRLVRDAQRPVFSPAVRNALVVHGD